MAKVLGVGGVFSKKIESRIRELELGEITLLDQDGNELPLTASN